MVCVLLLVPSSCSGCSSFAGWFPLPWPSLEPVPAVPGLLVPPWEWAMHRTFMALPAAVDLCLEALCECQGKLCFVLANSSHSLGRCGVCPAQGCAWALPGGSRGNISKISGEGFFALRNFIGI
ncbi:hypothetical protein Nmel_018108 [Mimus melanotis]